MGFYGFSMGFLWDLRCDLRCDFMGFDNEGNLRGFPGSMENRSEPKSISWLKRNLTQLQ